MKREDEFLSSIYEKRDRAILKRRRTLNVISRAGAGIAVFALVLITAFTVTGYLSVKDKATEMAYDEEISKEMQEIENMSADQREGVTGEGAVPTVNYQSPETKAETAPGGNISENWVKDDEREEPTFAATSAAGSVISSRYVEIVEATGDATDGKRNFEQMLTLFNLTGDSFVEHDEIYNGEAVGVYRMIAVGAMYIFRYNGYYCCVSDPDVNFTAIDAIELTDRSISEMNK